MGTCLIAQRGEARVCFWGRVGATYRFLSFFLLLGKCASFEIAAGHYLSLSSIFLTGGFLVLHGRRAAAATAACDLENSGIPKLCDVGL